MIQTGSIPQAIGGLDGLVKGNVQKVEYISDWAQQMRLISCKLKEAQQSLFKQASLA